MLLDLKELIQKYHLKINGIIHCGAHWGEEADIYERNHIHKVLWIEGDKKNYDILYGVALKYGHLRLNAFLGDETGKELTFNVANNDGQSSSFLDFGTHKKMHPETKYIDKYKAKTVRLDEVLAYNKVNIEDYNMLVADVQGFEMQVLKGAGDLLHKIKYLYLETNTDEVYKGCADVTQIDAYLKPFGFERWCNAPNGNLTWTDSFYARREDIYLAPVDESNFKPYLGKD